MRLLYMESKKKMLKMNLFTKTEIESQIHNRKQSYRYHGKKGEERRNKLGDWY